MAGERSNIELTLDSIRDVRLLQRKSGYRYSVDSLIIAGYVRQSGKSIKNCVDLGTGSGIIALLLASRFSHVLIHAVELQDSLADLAEKNIILNSLEERVKLIRGDVRDLQKAVPDKFAELVISNPPYRLPGAGRISRGQERALARHEININLAELSESASRILKTKGSFYIVHLPERLTDVLESLRTVRLEPKRMRLVQARADAEPAFVLVEAVKDGGRGLKVDPVFIMYDQHGEHTSEFASLYS